jgi:FK506-binding protein 1
MAVAAEGMLVKVHFQTIRNDNGEIIDSSRERAAPLTFVVGGGQAAGVLPGLDAGVRGMRADEEKTIPLPPEQGFGKRDEEKVTDIPLERLPKGIQPGQSLKIPGPRGPMNAVVMDVGEKAAILDFNHPLAGADLSMKVKVVSVEKAPSMEVVKETVQPGDGVTFPKVRDQLTMHYTGTLAASGKKFDSSHDRGTPLVFNIGIGKVIRGWDVGVMQMSLGERANLRVPAALAYGARGAGNGVIPPNSDLVFDVTLLKIN